MPKAQRKKSVKKSQDKKSEKDKPISPSKDLSSENSNISENESQIDYPNLKLHKLILENFKSFQGRNEIGYFQDFSVVLGPNGSGKSNIIDALSFVFGLNAQQMRTRNLKELIYHPHSSSSSNKAQNCSVEIIFKKNLKNPSQKLITQALDEISFRRTVNASGSSSFYFNDKKMTQEDYVQKLMDFSIPVNSMYFILGQGGVDSLFSSKRNKIEQIIEVLSGSYKYKERYDELVKKLEEKNNELNEENTKINNKLKTLKDNVLQLKTRLENDIYAKLDSKTKLLNESMSQNELLNKQNKSLNEEMEKLKLEKENFNLFREKFNTLMKEKTKNDVLSIKQEEMIKNLEGEISILNLECKEKDNRYKKLDDIYLGVIKVIEEHKKINQNLKNKLKLKEKEDKNKRLIIFQKEQEIILLRNFINSYKNDSKNKFRNGGDNVKSKLLSDNNYYKQRELPNLHKNRSSININTKNEISKTIIRTNNIPMRQNLPKVELKGNFNTSKKGINNYSNYFKKNNILDVNDKEEDNIKEITDLMKKMINE